MATDTRPVDVVRISMCIFELLSFLVNGDCSYIRSGECNGLLKKMGSYKHPAHFVVMHFRGCSSQFCVRRRSVCMHKRISNGRLRQQMPFCAMRICHHPRGYGEVDLLYTLCCHDPHKTVQCISWNI